MTENSISPSVNRNDRSNWRVNWQYYNSEYIGHGDFCYTKIQAQSIVDAKNLKQHNIKHWIEQRPSLKE